MPKKKKFSIGLDIKLLAEVDRFLELYNLQHILSMDRAKAIRILLRQGIQHQQIVPGAHTEESEWWHQDRGGSTLCGTTSEKKRPWGSAEAVTCPSCILAKRHTGPPIQG